MRIRIWDFVHERYIKNAAFIHLEVADKTEDEYNLVSENFATIEMGTGRQDCYGNEIFENDIIHNFGLDIYQIVKYSKEKARFELCNFDSQDLRYQKESFEYMYQRSPIKVIGSYNDLTAVSEANLEILKKRQAKEMEELVA